MKTRIPLIVTLLLPGTCYAENFLGVTSDQQLIMWAWTALGSFLVLLVMGLTNKVVVFANHGDLWSTLIIFIAPIVAFFIALTLDSTPEGAQVNLFDETVEIMVWSIGGIVAGCGILATFALSIKHNGLILGIIVAVFKIVASLVCALCLLGGLSSIFSKSNSLSAKLMAFVLLGFLMWILRKLINGEAVMARRAEAG